jgi:hypothetical protein
MSFQSDFHNILGLGSDLPGEPQGIGHADP